MRTEAWFGVGRAAGASPRRWPVGLAALVLSIALVAPARAAVISWSAPAPISHGSAFVGLSCPTASFCAAIDQYGDVVTTTDPTGGTGAWTTTNIASAGLTGYAGLNGIACPTASLCVVTDGINGAVFTSTDPTGGAGAWTQTTIDPNDSLDGVSCGSASLCVAVDANGDVLTTTDPTGGAGAWQLGSVNSSNQLDAVSCVGSSLCVAVGTGLATSTNPTAGAGTWTSTSSLTAAAVDCAAPNQCVAVDGSGDAFASSNPTGGPSAWKQTSGIDSLHPFQPMSAISCPSTTLCVAVGASGDAAVSTDPVATTNAWTGQSIDSTGLGGVSCPTRTVCIAADDSGDAVVGTVTGGTTPPGPTTTAPVAIKSATAVVRGVRTMVRVGCTSASGCAGVVTVRATVRRRVVRRIHHHRRTVTVTRSELFARRHYRIPSGTHPLSVRLAKQGVHALRHARRHRLRVTIRITVRGGRAVHRTITLRLR